MTLQWSVEKGIGLLKLNQPPSNTLSMRFFRDFGDLISTVNGMDELKALVITGSGRHFSAGSDINELLDSVDEKLLEQNYHSFLLLRNLPIPVIAAIRGVCLGSAFELALFCHFRICTTDAILGLPETTFNLMPGIGGIQRVKELAGKAKAIRLVLSGDTFPADEAFTNGLVDALVPKNLVVSTALEFAAALPRLIRPEDRRFYLYKYFNRIHAKD